MSNRAKVIGLYRQLMHEADKFTTSNFRWVNISKEFFKRQIFKMPFLFSRVYAKNRIQHEFELNRNVTDLAKQQALIEKAEKSLSSLKRQVCILIQPHVFQYMFTTSDKDKYVELGIDR